jgi:hypothetical protein
MGLAGLIAALAGAGQLAPARAAQQAAPATAAPAAATPSPSATSPHSALIGKYCVTCHNARMKAGGLMLDAMDVANVQENAESWEKVVRKLRAGLMPPAGMPRPGPPAAGELVEYLEQSLDQLAAASPNPGRTEALHRLNRTEYHNTIRDLLALDVDVVDLLPADDTSYGFDTIAGALAVSPTLLERYISAARKISRLAVGRPVPSPTAETFRVASDLPQDGRIDGLPFGTRGGTIVHYNFPQSAEYVIRVEPEGRATDSHTIEVMIDGERVELFTLGPTRAPGGDYSTPVHYETRVPVKAGPRTIGVTFIARTDSETEALRQPFLRPYGGQVAQPRIESVTITGPLSATPLPSEETASRRRIFVCRPANASDEDRCAAQILSTLARRAYRREVSSNDVQSLLTFYRVGRKEGFDAGIESALRRLLVSPDFLFRIERDPANVAPNAVYRISDVELASRLSFFLWSTIPDDELLDAAIRNELRKPNVLERQVRRMLADRRSHALVTSWAAQWLVLRRVDAALPDQYLFPDFDESLMKSLQEETELFLESFVRDDRSVLELLTADYTFVNERLARHYGIPNVYGSHFRRVALPSDSPRRGLLGHGSILTLTSYPARTSPVVRGKWILENILGTPPPPPPPDVPALTDNSSTKVLTMRERMSAHRANPVCASCHTVMDPLGLSLENFDAVGRWRDRMEGETAIDVSGAFPDGTKFDGVGGLRDVLLKHPEQFVTNVIERLMTYGLGRGVEFYDAPAVRTIRREAAGRDYAFSALVLGIVKSPPFQMRRSLPPGPAGESTVSSKP